MLVMLGSWRLVGEMVNGCLRMWRSTAAEVVRMEDSRGVMSTGIGWPGEKCGTYWSWGSSRPAWIWFFCGLASGVELLEC